MIPEKKLTKWYEIIFEGFAVSAYLIPKLKNSTMIFNVSEEKYITYVLFSFATVVMMIQHKMVSIP